MEIIEQMKKRYQGEWLAIEITKYEEFEPVEGNLLHHSKERAGLWRKVKLDRERPVYITYAGPFVEEGYAVAFYAV